MPYKNSPTAAEARRRLRALADPAAAVFLQRYFKTGRGEYGEGDIFIGVKIPPLRKLAHELGGMKLAQVDSLLRSPIHEERLLSLEILLFQFARADALGRKAIFRFYLGRTRYINNWDLVDDTAGAIVGCCLWGGDMSLLDRLSKSSSWWERRIAVVATFYFIRRNKFTPTLRLARRLLSDEHDLMHKAVGWMLREVGKRDQAVLRRFLDRHVQRMPRTTLRYAIERFSPSLRLAYLRA